MTSRYFLSLAENVASQRVAIKYEQISRTFQQAAEATRQTSRRLSESLLLMLPIALSTALMPVAAHANGTMVDMFTYNGTELGKSAAGNVYAMSIAGTELNTCLFSQTSNTSPPNQEYTPSCENTLAPPPIDSNTYTAVAYLGGANNPNNPANNPNNYFAVGDSGGNIYLMKFNFSAGNPNPTNVQSQQTYSLASPDNASNSCGSIASLAVDPAGTYLYVSCIQTKGSIGWHASNSTIYRDLFGVTLGVYSINKDGSLSFVNNVSSSVPSGNNGYWTQGYNSNSPASSVTAAAFPNFASPASNLPTAVNPKLRVYPQNYPGLAGTSYATSGGVFLSGILSGFSNDAPINSGFMCSAGQCTVTYNIALKQGEGGWLFSAAEFGNNQLEAPVLYWNQVQASVAASGSVGTLGIFSEIDNVLTTCQLNPGQIGPDLVTSTPCSVQTTINWPPVNSNVPSSTIWIDQLVFSPTPAVAVNDTSFTQGLLQISAWNNGYLAYYDVAAQTPQSGLFFSNNKAGGEVGANVQGITTDSNGNMLIQAGSSGLLGFNAFPSSDTNIETQQNVTYVPIPVDTNANSCGALCVVTQGYKIARFIVSNVISVAGSENDEVSNRARFALHSPILNDVFQKAGRQYEGYPWIESHVFNSNATKLNGLIHLAMNVDSGASGDLLGNVMSDADPSLVGLAESSTAAPLADVLCCDANSNAPSPSLANFLGPKPYWGQFTYSEQQMNLMGVRSGDIIKGLQFRLAEGISAQPKEALKFNTLQIRMFSDGSSGDSKTATRSGPIVFKRGLTVTRCSYNRAIADGYGPVLTFKAPYRYRGGDLKFTLRHSGSKNSKRFYLNGVQGPGVSGAYAQIPSVWSYPKDVTEFKVAPQILFTKKGTVPRDVTGAPQCN